MSDDTSARLALPLLAAGQAQKEMTVNEAMARLDIAVQAQAVASSVDDPPEGATTGDCWIVGDAPTGDWAGMTGALAGWTGGGWRFVAPIEGMTVWLTSAAQIARFHGGGWEIGMLRGARVVIAGMQVIGARRPAIVEPGGGEVIDDRARATVAEILEALRSHGLIAT